jgi:hypothetical protein
MAYSGGVAAAAAAERQQMMFAEEESMARYMQDDLNNDWEFKIVRSDSAAFHKPEALKKLLEEEARAGWAMLEKFDDGRVRFKRPRRARTRDTLLPPSIDPYRTQYGISSTRIGLLVVALMMLALLAFGALGFWFFVIR